MQTLLRDALIALIEERRDFDRITVNELVQRAMISRAAFYRNYRDKYQLVEELFDAAMTEVRGGPGSPDGWSPYDRLIVFFDHLAEYAPIYRALLAKRGDVWFADRMVAAMIEMVSPHFPAAADPRAADLVPTMLGSMFAAGVTWWLHHEQPLSSQQMAARSAALAAAVIAEVNSWPPAGPDRLQM